MGRIPFDPAFTQSMVEGMTVIEYGNSAGAEAIRTLWQNLEHELFS